MNREDFLKKKKELYIWLKKDKNQFFVVGIFFLVMQLFIFLANYNTNKYDVFFWFCNHTPLFFGIAFLMNKKDIIKGLINVGFFGQFVWMLDFIGKIFFNHHIFNMTNYVFENPNGLWVLVPIIIHIFATNVALIFTYDKKPNIYSAFYSLVYICFLYGSTITYTAIERNVNWVFKLGGTINYAHPLYTNFWPILVFLIIAMPTQLMQYVIYIFHKRKLRRINKSIKK